jgi:hypothetical protein
MIESREGWVFGSVRWDVLENQRFGVPTAVGWGEFCLWHQTQCSFVDTYQNWNKVCLCLATVPRYYRFTYISHCYTTEINTQPCIFGFGNVWDCNTYWSNDLGNLSLSVTVKPPAFVLVMTNAICYMGKEWRQNFLLMLLRMCSCVYTFICVLVVWIIQVSGRQRGDFSINCHVRAQICTSSSGVTTIRLLRLTYYFRYDSYNLTLSVNSTLSLTFTIIHFS